MYTLRQIQNSITRKMFISENFFCGIFADIKNVRIFAPVIENATTRIQKLFNGVMVAQQILVLFVQVRILVEQQLSKMTPVNQWFAGVILLWGTEWGTDCYIYLFNIYLCCHFIRILFQRNFNIFHQAFNSDMPSHFHYL